MGIWGPFLIFHKRTVRLLFHNSDTDYYRVCPKCYCSTYETHRACTLPGNSWEQQGVLNGILVLKRLETFSKDWTRQLCCFSSGRVNSLFTSLPVYTLLEKPDLGDESEFDEGSQLHPGIVGEDSWTNKDHNTGDSCLESRKNKLLGLQAKRLRACV